MIEANCIYVGDCVDVMRSWEPNVIDTIITDPPYGIRFMGKAWDGADIENMVQAKMRKETKRPEGWATHKGEAFAAGTYDQSVSANRAFQMWCEAWATEALRIAKPGAMMLVSGGTRTFHRMTSGLEDAGWQIRDCLMWLYGSGFPKSLDISKAIDKAKGAEREVVGVRDDKSRASTFGGSETNPTLETLPASDLSRAWNGWGTALKPAWEPIIVCMKPLDDTFAENAERHGVAGLNIDGSRIPIDFKCGGRESGKNTVQKTSGIGFNGTVKDSQESVLYKAKGRWPANLILDEDAAAMLDGQTGEWRTAPRGPNTKAGGIFGVGHAGGDYSDFGGASRFFYCAKASKSERGAGNVHPTVKPLKLMEYLCTLTKTPTGGIVLDPFAGSGSTLLAAQNTGRPWIGIEMNEEYAAIARARLADGPQLKLAV